MGIDYVQAHRLLILVVLEAEMVGGTEDSGVREVELWGWQP